MNPWMEAPVLVHGRHFLRAIDVGLVAGLRIGSVTFFGWRSVAGASVGGQVVTLEVLLFPQLFFRVGVPADPNPPLAYRYTNVSDLKLALVTWLGILATASVVYLALAPITGNLLEGLRNVLAIATDAKRLHGKPLLAWCIAIPRAAG